MWFGSSVGLTRYDGEQWLRFTVHNGLPANDVVSMAEDDSLRLWIGTRFGLVCFDISDINNPILESLPADFSNKDITKLYFDEGILWIGTAGHGLYTYRKGAFREHPINKFFPSAGVLDIDQTTQETALILKNQGLIIIDHDEKIVRSIPNEPQLRFSAACFSDLNNELLLGSESGLYKFGIKSNEISLLPGEKDAGAKPAVHDLTIDREGKIWVATNEGILTLYRGRSEWITKENGLPSNFITKIYIDKENNHWIGTLNAGLVKLTGLNIMNYSQNSGLESGSVNAIFQESLNAQLLATDAGIFRMENQIISRDIRFRDLDKEIIWHIYKDKDEYIWVAGENIIAFHNRKELTLNPLQNKEKCTYYDMIQDQRGLYWFATSNGLIQYDGFRFKYIEEIGERGIRRILDIEELKDGVILLGTDNGLVQYKNQEFLYYTKENGLPDRAIYEIHEDRRGQVWLGCDLGLIKVMNRGFRLYGIESGLEGTIITQILEDSFGVLWLCSDKGLQKFENGMVTRSITSRDGLIGDEFTTQNSSLIDGSGRFWLGVFGGLTLYDPGAEVAINSLPKVSFSRAEYFLDSSKPFTFINESMAYVPFSHRSIVFDFRGLYFRDEQSLRFRYMLEGIDNSWNEIGRDGEVRYNNLWPGTYTLKVRSVLPEGETGGELTEKIFVVEKPFWLQYWFLLLLVIVFILVGYQILRARTDRIRRLNRQLSKKVAIRARELALTKALLENIIENAGSAIITVDKKGKIETWNKRAEQVFSYPKREILTKNIKILDIENDLSPFKDILKDVETSGELHQLELKKKGKNGRLAELILTITPLLDEYDEVYSYTLAMEDFSERNRVIDSVINREKLLAGIGALNQLLATLSHYINNSIMAINGMGQLAQMDNKYMDKFFDTTTKQVHRIQAVLDSLSKLVQQLNLKTRDYVGEKDILFDIENEIQHFLKTIRK